MHNVNKVLDSQSNCRITKKSSWTLFLFKSGNVKRLFTSFNSIFFILTKQLIFCEITKIYELNILLWCSVDLSLSIISQYKDTSLIINYCFCSIFIYLLILQPNAVKV